MDFGRQYLGVGEEREHREIDCFLWCESLNITWKHGCLSNIAYIHEQHDHSFQSNTCTAMGWSAEFERIDVVTNGILLDRFLFRFGERLEHTLRVGSDLDLAVFGS